ncbi:unnamed protein product [Effrenium voratum]|nr:unnamed protein product [Effrenium voratum]
MAARFASLQVLLSPEVATRGFECGHSTAMANTASGFVAEGEAYNKILYVSKDRLQELKKKLTAKGSDITAEEVKGMMYPEDMDDDAVLIPVDVSGEEEGFPTSCEDLLEKVGASGAAKAIVDAAEFFEKNKVKKFGNDQRPIPMTVGEWMSYMMADEGGAEENGEEEELEDDEVVEPTPKKKPRTK